MKTAVKKQPQIIAPDAYPQMMSKPNAARAALTLRSAQVAEKAQAAMEAQIPAMRAAILGYVEELEKAQGDMTLVFEKAHEIRGFAETAGLVTTGRIADILCRYMDDMERIKKPLDITLVALNVSAIGRAARTEDGNAAMGDVVAAELAALVARRLADAGQG
jgi:HPt (histidine-containing phosphotransfer) domain-containing protein